MGSLEQRERVTERLSEPLACLWTPPMAVSPELTAHPFLARQPQIRVLRQVERQRWPLTGSANP